MADRRKIKLKADVDFRDMVAASKDASKRVQDLFEKAFSLKGARREAQRFQSEQTQRLKDLKDLQVSLDARVYRQRALADKRDNAARIEAEEEIARLRRKLADKLSDEERKKSQAELKAAEKRRKLFESTAEEFTDQLEESYKQLDSIVGEMSRVERTLGGTVRAQERSAEALRKLRDSVTGEMFKGGEEFASRMEELFDSVGDKLTGSIDPAAIAKSVSAGVGKGLSRVGDATGNRGLGFLFGGAGAAVTILGSLAGVLLDTDKRMKEFNRTSINTHGSLELAALGGGNLNQGLRVLNHTVTDLQGNFGVTEQEATALFDSLDRGGITLDSLTGRTRDAVDAQARLTEQIAATYRVASATGVGLGEYAQNLTEYVQDLGQSLTTVNDSFGTIADMANRSSFGTRRFYSMVVQATSGQASLNTHLEETGDLLLRMSKVLGAKKATELVGQHGNDLQNLSTQDRYRLMLTSGSGRVRQTLRDDASSQARNFARDATNSTHLGGALQEAGLTQELRGLITQAGGSNADPAATAALVKALGRMGAQQRDALVASLTSRDEGLGRRLGQLTTVARGAERGGMGNMSDALSGMSAGGSIVTRLNSAMAVLGRPLNELTGIQRMAAEQITGLSEEQFEAMQKIAANAQGQYEILRRIQSQRGGAMSEEERADLARRFGATINDRGQIVAARATPDGRRIESVGEAIRDSQHMITAAVERSGEAVATTRSEQTALMNDTYEATVSLQDIVENKMLYYVRGLYEDVGMPVLDAVYKLLGVSKSDIDTKSLVRNQTRLQVGNAQKNLSERSRSLSLKRTQLSHTTDPEARQRLTQEIQTLEAGVTRSREDIDRYRAIGTEAEANVGVRGAQGNKYFVRRGNETDDSQRLSFGTWQEAQNYSSQWGGEVQAEALNWEELWRNASNNHRPTAGAPAPAAMAMALARPAAPPAATGAAATAQAPAPAPAPAPRDVNPVATEATSSAIAAGAAATATAVTTEGRETRTLAAELHNEAARRTQTMLTRETKLGNALARSDLPDAIAKAHLKLQFEQAAYAAGLDSAQVAAASAEYMGGGTVNMDLQRKFLASGDQDLLSRMHLFGIRANQLGSVTDRRFGRSGGGPTASAGASEEEPDDVPEPVPRQTRRMHDFVYQGGAGRPTITPIDREDQVVGMRPGGAVDRARSPGNVTIHINGGDQRAVYQTVRRALDAAGFSPNRVNPGG